MFFLLSGFKSKSFLIVGIPEGLIIRIVDQCQQNLWHQLLKQNHRLSFHHPNLTRWVKLHVTELLMINLLRQVQLQFLSFCFVLFFFVISFFWSCLPHPATPSCLSFSSPPTPPYIYNSNILSVLLYGAECWRITQRASQRLSSFRRPYFTYLQKICKIYWPQNNGDEALYPKTGQRDISTTIK